MKKIETLINIEKVTTGMLVTLPQAMYTCNFFPIKVKSIIKQNKYIILEGNDNVLKRLIGNKVSIL